MDLTLPGLLMMGIVVVALALLNRSARGDTDMEFTNAKLTSRDPRLRETLI